MKIPKKLHQMIVNQKGVISINCLKSQSDTIHNLQANLDTDVETRTYIKFAKDGDNIYRISYR